MTREEKNFMRWLFWIGKDMRRKGLPYFKNGTRVTVDQYYSIFSKVMREKEEQGRMLTDKETEIFFGEIGEKSFRAGYYGHMPYEIKSEWQKKRSLRQQRSIQKDTLSTPILP